ncbi:MAG: urate hydroxylase PuuD [Gemmatimonadales bacterium]
MAPSLDWINLLVRWIHFGTGIAWIGSSFYFVWLDSHLTAPESPRKGVEGEIWMVHSGGFYQVEKRLVGPGTMPKVLHWFKYEALFTWITGAILLTVVYYLTGGVYLVDPAVSSLTPGQATIVAISAILLSWLFYDWLWQSPLGRIGWPATAISLALLAVAVFALTRLLSGRAAYIHIGAMLGTIMVANVWHRILPAQQRMIDATKEGREPDFSEGRAAKRRSIHNSYMTFPVLFIMLSNHFPQTYGGPYSWVVLALLIVAGVSARHAMIGKTKSRAWATVPLVVSLVAVVGLATPRRVQATAAAASAVPFGEARAVINRRCLQCHSRFPTDSVFTTAPVGVMFDTPEDIQRRADRIRERAVIQQTMPLANRTGITAAERDVLRRWLDGGARLE